MTKNKQTSRSLEMDADKRLKITRIMVRRYLVKYPDYPTLEDDLWMDCRAIDEAVAEYERLN